MKPILGPLEKIFKNLGEHKKVIMGITVCIILKKVHKKYYWDKHLWKSQTQKKTIWTPLHFAALAQPHDIGDQCDDVEHEKAITTSSMSSGTEPVMSWNCEFVIDRETTNLNCRAKCDVDNFHIRSDEHEKPINRDILEDLGDETSHVVELWVRDWVRNF